MENVFAYLIYLNTSRINHRRSQTCFPHRIVKIMPPKKHNQPTRKTPTLQIDATTFQAAVTAAVTAVMAHLNAEKCKC